LAIASSSALKNSVPRTVFAPRVHNTEASLPVSVSASRSSFASVCASPARKLRYSSFNVGVRNARYTVPRMVMSDVARNDAATRGLTGVSDWLLPLNSPLFSQ
jgi:hypothetical protein